MTDRQKQLASEMKRGAPEQIQLERQLTVEAIEGAMAFGYQNMNPPPSDDHWLAPFWKIGRQTAELEAQVATPDVPDHLSQAGKMVAPHPDDLAVDRFASQMKAKLAAKRAAGYGGWDDPKACHVETLARRLVEHIEKGDPVDVANFAMMLHHRGANEHVLPAALTIYANPIKLKEGR